MCLLIRTVVAAVTVLLLSHHLSADGATVFVYHSSDCSGPVASQTTLTGQCQTDSASGDFLKASNTCVRQWFPGYGRLFLLLTVIATYVPCLLHQLQHCYSNGGSFQVIQYTTNTCDVPFSGSSSVLEGQSETCLPNGSPSSTFYVTCDGSEPTSPSSSSTTSSSAFLFGLSLGTCIGILCGGIAFIALFVAFVWWYLKPHPSAAIVSFDAGAAPPQAPAASGGMQLQPLAARYQTSSLTPAGTTLVVNSWQVANKGSSFPYEF